MRINCNFINTILSIPKQIIEGISQLYGKIQSIFSSKNPSAQTRFVNIRDIQRDIQKKNIQPKTTTSPVEKNAQEIFTKNRGKKTPTSNKVSNPPEKNANVTPKIRPTPIATKRASNPIKQNTIPKIAFVEKARKLRVKVTLSAIPHKEQLLIMLDNIIAHPNVSHQDDANLIGLMNAAEKIL